MRPSLSCQSAALEGIKCYVHRVPDERSGRHGMTLDDEQVIVSIDEERYQQSVHWLRAGRRAR
jgi:hypothetical protein